MTQQTILIVEDTDMTRKLYRIWLREKYNLLEASDGKTALAHIKEKSIDCILLDYQLPDINGVELIKKCSLIQEKNIPVIILTAHGSEKVAVEALKLGAVDYYVKSDLTQEILNQAVVSSIEKVIRIQKTKAQYSEMKFMAFHDHLTCVYNRAQFEESVKKSLVRANRFKKKMAILMIDLDHFKNVNDTLGHEAGDLLLKEITARFSKEIREVDTLARLGGDEFAIIIDDLDKTKDAEFVATKLLSVALKPVVIKNNTIHISTSIGIAVYPDEGKTLSELIENADAALYAAKKSGRNTFCYFTKN